MPAEVFAEMIERADLAELGIVEFDIEEALGHEHGVHHRKGVAAEVFDEARGARQGVEALLGLLRQIKVQHAEDDDVEAGETTIFGKGEIGVRDMGREADERFADASLSERWIQHGKTKVVVAGSVADSLSGVCAIITKSDVR